MTQPDVEGPPDVPGSNMHPWPDEENDGGDEADPNNAIEISAAELEELEADLGVPVESRTSADNERSIRLARDRRIVQMLGDTGFEGDRFERLFGKLSLPLIEYSWPIMDGWIRSQKIFERCARCRGGLIRPDDRRNPSEEDRDLLVADTVLGAREWFRTHALPKGKWNPELGATLSTHFVGACLHRFPRVYHKWFREQQVLRTLRQVPTDDQESWAPWLRDTRAVDPEAHAIVQDEVHRALVSLNDASLQRVVVLQGMGYTQKDAASAEHLTEDAVQSRLARYRKKCRPSDKEVTFKGDGTIPATDREDVRGEKGAEE